MEKPIALILFDMTGLAVEPWAEAGYDCMCIDIQPVLPPGLAQAIHEANGKDIK